GSTLAALLASRGRQVALIDRDTFPRDKVCGEFLSYDALPLLDDLGVLQTLLDAGVPELTHCRVVSRRHTYEFDFPRAARGVSRVERELINVCGLVHATRLAHHKGRWDAFVEQIRDEEPPLEAMYGRVTPAQEHYLSSEPVIFRSRSAVEEGIFMLGDASGVI